jgi:hypothetical protein
VVTSELALCVRGYQELSKDRIYYEGVPSPITFGQLSSYHASFIPAVRFYIFKAIVEELDVYEMAKYSERQKANARKNKVK